MANNALLVPFEGNVIDDGCANKVREIDAGDCPLPKIVVERILRKRQSIAAGKRAVYLAGIVKGAAVGVRGSRGNSMPTAHSQFRLHTVVLGPGEVTAF